MPAPDVTYRQIDSRPALGHVWAHISDTSIQILILWNDPLLGTLWLTLSSPMLQQTSEPPTDSFFSPLLNQLVSYSLRSIIRNLLATGPPGVAPAFTSAARSRLRQTNTKTQNSPYLFQKQTRDKPSEPMPPLYDLLTRARSLYGAGLGFASLAVLSSIVRATIGLRWEDDGDMADILAVIDADIGQAIQASFRCPRIIYTTPDLINRFPEFERRNRRWPCCRLYIGTRSKEWATMRCERQSSWCEILGRRISVWKSCGEYWILENLSSVHLL